MTMLCDVHGTPLKLYCPHCRGSRGGAATSPKKAAASREALALARAIKQAKKAGQVR